MQEIIEKIQTLNESQLQQLMEAIEDRYAQAYPEWDVVYIALHKDPGLRFQEYANLLDMIGRDLLWLQEQQGEPHFAEGTKKGPLA